MNSKAASLPSRDPSHSQSSNVGWGPAGGLAPAGTRWSQCSHWRGTASFSPALSRPTPTTTWSPCLRGSHIRGGVCSTTESHVGVPAGPLCQPWGPGPTSTGLCCRGGTADRESPRPLPTPGALCTFPWLKDTEPRPPLGDNVWAHPHLPLPCCPGLGTAARVLGHPPCAHRRRSEEVGGSVSAAHSVLQPRELGPRMLGGRAAQRDCGPPDGSERWPLGALPSTQAGLCTAGEQRTPVLGRFPPLPLNK